MEVHPIAPTQDSIAENSNNGTPLEASPVRLVLPGKGARIPLCLLHPPDTIVDTPVRSIIRPVLTGHVPDNQSQDGPVNVSCDFTGLTGERCADQLASPTILGKLFALLTCVVNWSSIECKRQVQSKKQVSNIETQVQ